MVGWARFCAHADTKPRGQTINLSAHPTLFFDNKFTLGQSAFALDDSRDLLRARAQGPALVIVTRIDTDGRTVKAVAAVNAEAAALPFDPPFAAKRLTELLQQLMKEYESRYGALPEK